MITANEALQQLKEGNRRFVNGGRVVKDLTNRERLTEVMKGQEPFAIVLGCSDARVPLEIVFDHGLGDLFVIRVAGNIVAPSQVGSIEFAAERFGTRLVVVLGHSNCGAIAATVEELETPDAIHSPNLASIINRIRPSVEPLFNNGSNRDHDELLHDAMLANVRASVDQLRHGSAILENLVQNDSLQIVGAEYSVETGQVDFLENQHEAG
ncbi:MAG: carbonic anhydrase [Verrucomicrobia subdivision 3 bacterium]|nr:carbonic anhydrase [Limisphaerales bacterium]